MKETSGDGYSKAEQLRLREASDRLCREYGLSVIEKLRKAPSRPVWLDEKNGKPDALVYNLFVSIIERSPESGVGRAAKCHYLFYGEVY